MNNYVFTDFKEELEVLPGTHEIVLRRESEVILRDEYATSILLDLYPEVYRTECEGWARSYYTLHGHMKAILSYGTPDIKPFLLNQQNWRQSIIAVQNELRSLPITRAFDIQTELDQVHYEQSSSAGYGYVGPKGPIKGVNHMRAIQRAKATVLDVRDRGIEGMTHAIKESVPDVGYTRTQLTHLVEKTKVRGVWGRAFHYILIEGTAARPVLENFIKGSTFFHIGEDPQLSVPRVLFEVSRTARWLYALDWSAFDSSVSRFEIDTAFQLLKERVLFPNLETELAFDLSKQLFTHKKVAAPDGKFYWAHKGIPSGSYYTSIIGSIINRLRIEYIWRQVSGHSPKICYTQGDDSLIGDDDLIKPEALSFEAIRYGWTLNASKTEYSTMPERVTFLGRTIHGSLNARERIRCLRLLIFPEYPVESGRISAYRARSLAEDCGYLSEYINKIAAKLKRLYGIADESEVPLYFRRYIP